MKAINFDITSKDKIIIKDFESFIKDENPQIPFYQREFIDERVIFFYNKILENNEIPFLSMLYLAKYLDKNYILDGQHRFYAYKSYYDKTKINFNICFNIKYCDNESDVKTYFRDLNNNYYLHNLILNDDDMDKAKEIKKYLKDKYSTQISKSESPKFPNFNLDQVCNYFLEIFKHTPGNEILHKIEFLNLSISNSLEVNDIDSYNKAFNKQKFFIGYIFIKKNKINKISASLRSCVWRKVYNNSNNGNCYVCNIEIHYENYHASHIISIKNGGLTNIHNLKICCSICNLSMGTKNLEDFKKGFC